MQMWQLIDIFLYAFMIVLIVLLSHAVEMLPHELMLKLARIWGISEPKFSFGFVTTDVACL